VKFSLFPSETRGLELLLGLCAEVQNCIQILSQLLGAISEDRPDLTDELNRAETRATDLHYALLTHLRTSFVNPLPREDLYTFSRLLHEVVAGLCGAGELMGHPGVKWLSERAGEQLEILGRQAELTTAAIGELDRLDDLEDTWLQMVRTTKRAFRTHRTWMGELSDLQKASTVIKHRSVAEQLLGAANSLRAVADHLGRVLVKES
jgi:uncharacterized protein Yka (UPF0111/DUF47 family)